MSELLARCTEYFSTANLYDVLGVNVGSTPEEIKRAYFKLSLKVHPDKVDEGEREFATKKFQTLGRVYAILADHDKRVIYDESGTIDDDTENEERDWDKYWRLLFKKVTVIDIEEFKQKYIGSQEETDDLRKAYLKFEGDMDMIVQCVPFADVEEEPRLREVLDRIIADEDLPKFQAFLHEDETKSNKRKRKAKKEAAAAKKAAPPHEGGDDFENLAAAIANNAGRREQQMNSLLANLEAKYGGKSARSGSKKKDSSRKFKK